MKVSRSQGLIPGDAHVRSWDEGEGLWKDSERQKDSHCSQGQKTRDTGKLALGRTSTKQ